jgi:leucyl-tRNA synthetase
MPQWAGSCWYYLRFCDPHNAEAAWGKTEEQYWMPVDLYVGGVEHAVLHLLYARFWHKVLYDLGLVSTKEPFQALRNQGLLVSRSYQLSSGAYVDPEEVRQEGESYVQMGTGEVLRSQIEKMSKSKLNGVTPDTMIADYGADALRLYEMFMGPFDREKVWNTDAVSGCRRFLTRFYDLVTADKVGDDDTEEASRLIHRLIHSVESDIEAMQFNTAIAKMMEFLNAFSPLPTYPRSALRALSQLLYPFAPHIAEEAWEILGGKESLTYEPFPQWDPALILSDTATYVIQVNGKLRARWVLPKGESEESLLSRAQNDPSVNKFLTGKLGKVVYVPDKLLSIVCHV